MQQEPLSRSHLRLRVLDGRALPVQEAILRVDHLLGLAGLLKSRLQLQRHVLAHCRTESTGELVAFAAPGEQDCFGNECRESGWTELLCAEQTPHRCPKD